MALLWNQDVESAYPDQTLLLPMVKVQDRTNRPVPDALGAMERAVRARIDVDALFEDAADLRGLCELSGGHIRHLMQMLRDACVRTESDVITTKAILKARQAFVNGINRRIPDDALPTLHDVHETNELPHTPEAARLLHQLLVLEYRNDVEWHDVHPAVLETRAYQTWPPPESDA